MLRTAEALAMSRFTSASSAPYFVGTLDPSRIASVSFLPIRSQSESVHILSPANTAAGRLHDTLAVAVVHDLAAVVAGDLRRVAFDVPAPRHAESNFRVSLP